MIHSATSLASIALLRNGGWALLALICGYSFVSNLGDLLYRGAFETWYVVAAVGTAMAGFYPLAAAFGAWSAQRVQRSQLDEATYGLDRFIFGAATGDLVSIVVWTLVATLSTFAGVILVANQRVVAGRIPWEVIPPIILAMVLAVIFGYFVGLVAAGTLPTLLATLCAPLGSALIVLLGLEWRALHSDDRALDGVIPITLTDRIFPHPTIEPDRPLMLWSSAWFLLATATTLIGIALWKRRTLARFVLLTTVASGALLAASQAMAASESMQRMPMAVELACTTQRNVSICTHPQFRADLPDMAEPVTAVTAPLQGLPGIPTIFVDPVVDSSLWPPDAAGFAPMPDDNRRAHRTVLSLVQIAENEQSPPSASQLAISCGITIEAGYTCDIEPRGTLEGQEIMAGGGSPDELTELDSSIRSRADAFAALPSDQQRAWLERRWAELRSGELTLDELPE